MDQPASPPPAPAPGQEPPARPAFAVHRSGLPQTGPSTSNPRRVALLIAMVVILLAPMVILGRRMNREEIEPVLPAVLLDVRPGMTKDQLIALGHRTRRGLSGQTITDDLVHEVTGGERLEMQFAKVTGDYEQCEVRFDGDGKLTYLDCPPSDSWGGPVVSLGLTALAELTAPVAAEVATRAPADAPLADLEGALGSPGLLVGRRIDELGITDIWRWELAVGGEPAGRLHVHARAGQVVKRDFQPARGGGRRRR